MQSSRSYSALDRALHYVAFGAPLLQRSLGELENDLYRKQIEQVESRDEVFVTGLPRAGTTLVLELLHATGEFETFTYRDMPFVLSPLLWRRYSKSRRRRAGRIARAHGDGMEISFDSPEAFEEVAWLAHLRDRIVREHTLEPIAAEEVSEEAEEALQLLVRKVLLAAERPPAEAPARYLSKNNANISRLEALGRVFPTARILVVFRDPLAQAGSLMAQHRRFAALHATDRFAARYMRWLGHYEFGANFRPIDFDGKFGRDGVPAEIDAAFWLEYWTSAYGHALAAQSPQVRWVDYDRLARDPEPSLRRLAELAGIRQPDRLIAAAPRLRPATSRRLGPESCPASVLEAAQAVHRRLQDAAESYVQ
jgi:hypothetical protein